MWTDEERRKAREQYEEIRQSGLDTRLKVTLRQLAELLKRDIEVRVLVAEMLREDRYSESEIIESIERLKQKKSIIETSPGFLNIKGR